MAKLKPITTILVELMPRRMATIESSFKKTDHAPRKGDKLSLKLSMNLDITLKTPSQKNANKWVQVISNGNADVFAGNSEKEKDNQLLAKCFVKIESLYDACPDTEEEELKNHTEHFMCQSAIAIRDALRSLVASTDFHNMPLPFPNNR